METDFEASDDENNRLTYYSAQRVVFTNPGGYFNRIDRYETLFRSQSHYGLVCRKEGRFPVRWSSPPDASISPFLLYRHVPSEAIKSSFRVLIIR
jgi:hypothetical protein